MKLEAPVSVSLVPNAAESRTGDSIEPESWMDNKLGISDEMR